jgi:ectoine hydroxylase-related dioxygenase (phytanoyl-CoA dioxygenase family)
MVTAWVAITDATVENGCLQVQPQTIDQTILPHCPRTQTGIADGFINAEGAIPLPVKAGGAVLFHPLTPHGSLVNTTDGFRWSFDIRFNKTGQPTGRSHFPSFVARSRAHPETELHDWQVWKTMWEDTRARLSVAPHTDIHRWSSDAPYCA